DAEEGPPQPLRDIARLHGFRSMLWVPITNGGTTIGIISVTRTEPGAFAPHHVQLLQTFADQGVIAIENTRLFNETEEALERQTATADILKVIASSPSDVQPVFDAIASSSKQLIGGFSATVFRFVDGIVNLAAYTPVSPTADKVLKASFPRPTANLPFFELAKGGGVVQEADSETNPDAGLRDIARARGFRSSLFSPLMIQGTPIGLIVVTRKEPGPFAAHHVQLLETFADQAVIAIENVRLFDEVQARTRDLEESLQQQTATADVLKVISRSAFDLPSVLRTLVESAAKLCDADKATITREVNGVYYRAETYGFSEEFMHQIRNIPVAPERGSITGLAMLEGKAIQVEDVEADPDYWPKNFAKPGELRTGLGIPMMRNGAPIGVLALMRTEVRTFNDKQIELVQTFADQAVIAIENARLFDEVQAKTRDLEESLQQQTATADVLKVISRSAFDLQAVFDALISSAVNLIGAAHGTIYVRNGETFRIRAHFGVSKRFADYLVRNPPTPGMGSASGRVMLTGRVVVIPDILEDKDYAHPANELNRTRSMLAVPLLRNDLVEGVLVIAQTEPGAF